MITISDERLRFEKSGGSYTVVFDATSAISWEQTSVQTDRSWITATITQITNNQGVINIDVQANLTGERFGTIVFNTYDTDDKSQLFTIDINQDGGEDEPSIVITPTVYNISASATTLNFDIECININRVYADAVDWVTDIIIKDSYITMSIASNESLQDRSIQIPIVAETINGDEIVTNITINQSSYEYYFDLEEGTYDVDYRETAISNDARVKGITNLVYDEVPSWVRNLVVQYREDELFGSRYEIRCVVDYNNTSFDRYARIKFTATTTLGEEIVKYWSIAQRRNIIYYEFPIWRDTILTFPYDEFNYKIRTTDRVIYSGRSYSNTIKINDIIRSYLESNLDITKDGLQKEGTYHYFAVHISTDNWETTEKYYQLMAYYDYSYENNNNLILSDPISNTIDVRQKFLVTVMLPHAAQSKTLQINYPSTGQEQLVDYIPIDVAGVYTKVKSGLEEGQLRVNYDGRQKDYTVKNTCSRYCLYYLNTKGGWDSLLFDGKCVQSADTTINKYDADYDNTTVSFGTTAYLKQKTDKWKLTTGYLTDNQAIKMPLLLDSTKVYLHDLEENKITPVVIDTTSYEIKNYRNQGRKLFTYTIDVTNSQIKNIR